MAAVSCDQAELVETGFRHDRAWMVIDEHYRFLTQREHPAMALIRAVPTESGAAESGAIGSLILTVPGADPVEVPIREATTPPEEARIWGTRCTVADQGDEAANLLTAYLGRKCRLVRMHSTFRRELGSSFGGAQRMAVGFADSAPLLLTSEASLEALNHERGSAIPMDRFRPNLVVAGGTPWQEDHWKVIRIGGAVFRVVKDCIRCEIITVDQTTGEKGIEPLETLGVVRSSPLGPRFGMKVVHETLGTVRVGDPVEVLE